MIRDLQCYILLKSVHVLSEGHLQFDIIFFIYKMCLCLFSATNKE